MSGRGGGSSTPRLGGHWGFLTRDREDRVIPDIMKHFFTPRKISQLEVCQEGGGGQEGWYLEDIEDS